MTTRKARGAGLSAVPTTFYRCRKTSGGRRLLPVCGQFAPSPQHQESVNQHVAGLLRSIVHPHEPMRDRVSKISCPWVHEPSSEKEYQVFPESLLWHFVREDLSHVEKNLPSGHG